MKLTDQQRAELEALAKRCAVFGSWTHSNEEGPKEKAFVAAAEGLRALLADLEEAQSENERIRLIVPETLERLNDELCADNERLSAELAAVRQQLADAEFAAKDRLRLVLEYQELESNLRQQLAEAQALISDAANMLQSHDWLPTRIRKTQNRLFQADTTSLQSAIEQAVAPYKRDAERYQWLCGVATENQWIEFGGYTVKRFIDASIDDALFAKEKSNG